MRSKRFGFFGSILFSGCLAAGTQGAQHEHQMEHMNMAQAPNVKLEVRNDTAEHMLTIRLGPLNLPAHAGMNVAQAPEMDMTVPFDGWFVAYHPRLTDAAGKTLPGRLLHHVAFYNTARSDFLCPQRSEHIFGAGGEMGDWPATPGIGYRVNKGDRILVSTMFRNDTDTSYPETYLEVRAEYQPLLPGEPGLKNVYPTWFDVKGCSSSGYSLEPGRNVASGKFSLGYSGVLIGAGGHLHDYGKQLQLADLTRNEDVATLNAKLDSEGRVLSIPVVRFTDRGGFPLNKGDMVEVTAFYDNPTGKHLEDAAMGIVVGYFLPSEDKMMAELRRTK